MTMPRFFMEGAIPETGEFILPINEKELRHMQVRRIEPKEHVACCAEGGNCWEVEIVSLDNEKAVGKNVGVLPIEKLPNLTLIQGISKGDRMGQVIRQTTELGIQRIIPFMAQRTIVRFKTDERAFKAERWRRIALSAAKQSGRCILPIVDNPTDIEDICKDLKDFDRIVIAWEKADVNAEGRPLSIGDALKDCDFSSKVALIIGPEGGLTEEEVTRLQEIGDMVRAVSLGKLILRTETAGTVATALCMYHLGSLGNNK